jgi:predicted Zn-dependent protease
MTIEAIAEAIRRTPAIDEFTLLQEETLIHGLTYGATPQRRRNSHAAHVARVFVDHNAGRGDALFHIDPDADLTRQLEDAARWARASLGPAWRLPPAAAPARVATSDSEWLLDPDRALDSAAVDLIALLSSSLSLPKVSLSLRRSTRRVIASTGFDNSETSTRLIVHGTAKASGGAEVPLYISAGHKRALQFAMELETAAKRSLATHNAEAVPSGDYDVALDIEAYAPNDSQNAGFFEPLVRKSHGGAFERLHARQPVSAASAIKGEKLTLESDGTIDHAARSAAFGDSGEPVRRFTLVRDGIAADSALDLRQAALKGTLPNGGVRNLVVGSGTQTAAELLTENSERPLLHVHRVEGWRGDAMLAPIAWATLQSKGDSKPVRGGVIVGDLFQQLAHAYYSKEESSTSYCRGPRVVLLRQCAVRS